MLDRVTVLRGRTWLALLCVVAGCWAVIGGGVVRAQLGGDSAADPTDEAGDELVVAAFEVEPFVGRIGELPGGFMFEVWEQIADRQGWAFDVVWIESLDDLAEVVEAGGADVAVAPLTSTSEREARFDFTSAIVASGPVLGVHERTESPVTLVSALFSGAILRLLLWSVVGLLVLGHLMWWVDRRSRDSDFASGYLRGVWDGVWWATVTVTTVGYGDTAPKTGGGRVVALLAMLASLFLVGAFVSEVTTALQSERAASVVAGVGDLDGRTVAVVEDSSYEGYLGERGVRTVGYPTQTEVFSAARNGAVDVVVADEFALDAVGSDYGVTSDGTPLYDEFIAFAVREDSALRSDINAVLSDLHREGLVREIVDRWTD